VAQATDYRIWVQGLMEINYIHIYIYTRIFGRASRGLDPSWILAQVPKLQA